MVTRGKENMDDCDDIACKFCNNNKCMFGVRKRAGCYMEVDKDIMDRKVIFNE